MDTFEFVQGLMGEVQELDWNPRIANTSEMDPLRLLCSD